MPGMDAPFDGYGLFPDSRILASKDVETEPGGRWNAIILLISDDLEQLGRAIAVEHDEVGFLAACGAPRQPVSLSGYEGIRVGKCQQLGRPSQAPIDRP